MKKLKKRKRSDIIKTLESHLGTSDYKDRQTIQWCIEQLQRKENLLKPDINKNIQHRTFALERKTESIQREVKDLWKADTPKSNRFTMLESDVYRLLENSANQKTTESIIITWCVVLSLFVIASIIYLIKYS